MRTLGRGHEGAHREGRRQLCERVNAAGRVCRQADDAVAEAGGARNRNSKRAGVVCCGLPCCLSCLVCH